MNHRNHLRITELIAKKKLTVRTKISEFNLLFEQSALSFIKKEYELLSTVKIIIDWASGKYVIIDDFVVLNSMPVVIELLNLILTHRDQTLYEQVIAANYSIRTYFEICKPELLYPLFLKLLAKKRYVDINIIWTRNLIFRESIIQDLEKATEVYLLALEINETEIIQSILKNCEALNQRLKNDADTLTSVIIKGTGIRFNKYKNLIQSFDTSIPEFLQGLDNNELCTLFMNVYKARKAQHNFGEYLQYLVQFITDNTALVVLINCFKEINDEKLNKFLRYMTTKKKVLHHDTPLQVESFFAKSSEIKEINFPKFNPDAPENRLFEI